MQQPGSPLRHLVGAALLLLAAACTEHSPLAPSPDGRSLAPDRATFAGGVLAPHDSDGLLVTFRGQRHGDFTSAVGAMGGRVARDLPQLGVAILKGLSDSSARALASRADVQEVLPDVRVQWVPHLAAASLVTAQDDVTLSSTVVDQSHAAFFPLQWNIRITHASDAWSITPAGRGALVCILDTGIDPNHLDLAGKVDLDISRSFVDSEPDILDHNTHGTFVSAIVASNGIGVASVAPQARLCAVKVLDATGSGSFGDLIAGIVYAAEQHADVINMSLGSYVDLSDPALRALVRHLEGAILYARFRGSIVVASAGNDAIDLATDARQHLSVPAELPGVIAVGATAPTGQRNFDQLASYSNFGSRRFPPGGVTLFAPGGDYLPQLGGSRADLIVSACSEYQNSLPFRCGPRDYLLDDGTSVAAPMVSGEAAVIRSLLADDARRGGFDAHCVKAGTDDIGPRDVFGRGRMNVLKAAGCTHEVEEN